MRFVMMALGAVLLASPAMAHGMSARAASQMGQAPQTWDHEPGPGDRLNRFQVIYVNDHACPQGQIKKFTAGSRDLGVKATRECVVR